MNLTENVFYVSSIKEIDTNKYYDLVNMLKATLQMKLHPVHIEEAGGSFSYTIKEIMNKSRGRYSSGHYKRGIIVGVSDGYIHKCSAQPMCFEILNDDYLLEEAHHMRYSSDNMAVFQS